jgi:hypothetical protein
MQILGLDPFTGKKLNDQSLFQLHEKLRTAKPQSITNALFSAEQDEYSSGDPRI